MWRLQPNNAVYADASVRLELDPADPLAGASLWLNNDARVAQRLWSWTPAGHAPPKLADSYTRGDDLVLAYSPSEDFPFHTQADWRCAPASGAGDVTLINLVLSIRTHLLDTRPVYEVASEFSTQRVEPLAGGLPGALFTAADDAWTVVETIQPGDLRSPAARKVAAQGATVVATWRLFDLFLEKGVIRRARLSLAVAPYGAGRDEAARLAEQLRGAPAPLST